MKAIMSSQAVHWRSSDEWIRQPEELMEYVDFAAISGRSVGKAKRSTAR